MKRKLTIFLFAIATVATTLVAADKPNFSGDWKMDANKSDFGPMPAPASMSRKIDHQDPSLNIVDSRTGGPQGDMTMTVKYTTDGKETTNSLMGNDVKSTATWEGKTLIITSKMDLGGNELKLISKWSLSDDGKTLTDATHIVSPQGELDLTTVMVKQ